MRQVLMTVEDVFSITGRGILVTGPISGDLRMGDPLAIYRQDELLLNTVVGGIEPGSACFAPIDQVRPRGILLRGVLKDEVRRGDEVCCDRGAIHAE